MANEKGSPQQRKKRIAELEEAEIDGLHRDPGIGRGAHRRLSAVGYTWSEDRCRAASASRRISYLRRSRRQLAPVSRRSVACICLFEHPHGFRCVVATFF
jgi:hypothetical protein